MGRLVDRCYREDRQEVVLGEGGRGGQGQRGVAEGTAVGTLVTSGVEKLGYFLVAGPF